VNETIEERDECQRCVGEPAEEGEDYCWRCAMYLEEVEAEKAETEEEED
jgi:hypothetical protein